MLPDREWAFLNKPESEEFKLLVRAFGSIAWSLSVNNIYYEELLGACDQVLRAIDSEIGTATDAQ